MQAKIILQSFLLSVALLLAAMASAAGVSLDAAKQQGLVGEQSDGYLGAVQSNPSSDVRILVAEVNNKRRAEYRRIAETNNISLSDVEALAGQKTIEKTAPGNYVKLSGQGWQRK